MQTLHRTFLAAALALSFSAIAAAQTTVKIANILELSGPGATSGTNFKDGVLLAVKEINAAGGILGRKIEVSTSDNESRTRSFNAGCPAGQR